MTMTADVPARMRDYRGPLSNTEIWDRFSLRPGDVVVSTPPKCGTTWTQAIVLNLIHGRAGMDVSLNDLSPWIDCAFKDRSYLAETLDAQEHRRCIKSHTPLDGIPWHPEVTYLGVYRHPVDAHFSMRRHVAKMHVGAVPGLEVRFPADEGQGFDMFVDDDAPDGSPDEMTLDGIVRHYLTFRPRRHLPNVHLLHYADLSRDRAGQVARIAGVLGISHPPEVMAEIIDGVAFESMQGNYVVPSATRQGSTFRDGTNFFDSGTSRKWEGRVSDARMARYAARIAGMLPPEEVRWFEDGGPLPG